MIVKSMNGTPSVLNVAFSAMPVTIPGSAIGRSRTNEIVSRPKNLNRWTASAASVPRIRAMIVAPTAAWIDRMIALWSASFSSAAPNHLRVQSLIGHVCARPPLKAYRPMMKIGT